MMLDKGEPVYFRFGGRKRTRRTFWNIELTSNRLHQRWDMMIVPQQRVPRHRRQLADLHLVRRTTWRKDDGRSTSLLR